MSCLGSLSQLPSGLRTKLILYARSTKVQSGHGEFKSGFARCCSLKTPGVVPTIILPLCVVHHLRKLTAHPSLQADTHIWSFRQQQKLAIGETAAATPVQFGISEHRYPRSSLPPMFITHHDCALFKTYDQARLVHTTS